MTASRATIRPERPSNARRNATIAAVLVLLGWAILTIGVDPAKLADLPGQLARIVDRMIPLDVAYTEVALPAMIESLQIAWIGTIIGALLSLPLGFFGARNVSSVTVSNVIRQLLNAIRAVPELVVAIVLVTIVGLGPIAGVLAIGLHSIGTLGKLTAEVIEGIDPGPVEAARAAGGRPIQVQRWGVLPQVLPDTVAFWLYRFEINIRAAAVLGIVGAGGIGTVLQNTVTYRRWDKAGMAILIIIVITILVDFASGWVRRRIIEGAGAKRVRGDALEEPPLATATGGRVDTDAG
ncbi:MAG: phosphonate ABC transporter, permease protein PhnE [Chloroflexi bacterium]|nr:phosphonate ABC transporter, permease protein PhnE [Chloroflexota bacterium]